jgi:hypothetical protein
MPAGSGPPAPADESRDITVLVHPKPVELKSREIVIGRHWHDTDAMTSTREAEAHLTFGSCDTDTRPVTLRR